MYIMTVINKLKSETTSESSNALKATSTVLLISFMSYVEILSQFSTEYIEDTAIGLYKTFNFSLFGFSFYFDFRKG